MNSPTPSRILLLALLLGAVPVDGAEILVDGKSTAAAPNGTPLAPYKTISAALQVAKPGDRVVIQGGTYREHLAVPSGAENRPLTITAAPGQRVIVSGTKKLTGWKKHDDSIWTTTLDWRPERLMVGFTEQPIARVPNEGWWVMPSFKRQVLTDPEHLKNFQFDVPGRGNLRLAGGQPVSHRTREESRQDHRHADAGGPGKVHRQDARR